jgi:hypothetical protein
LPEFLCIKCWHETVEALLAAQSARIQELQAQVAAMRLAFRQIGARRVQPGEGGDMLRDIQSACRGFADDADAQPLRAIRDAQRALDEVAMKLGSFEGMTGWGGDDTAAVVMADDALARLTEVFGSPDGNS